MKKIAVLGLVAALGSAAHAQGYVGASIGRGKLSVDCAAGESCSDSASVFKLYAGTRIHQSDRFEIGVEAAYLRTVNELQRRSTTLRQGVIGVENEFDPGVYDETTPAMGAVPFKQNLGLDAVIIAPVFKFKFTPQLSAFVKPGIGLVNATLKNRVENVENATEADFRFTDGGSERSDTEFQIQPYVSVGVSFEVMPNLTVVGAFDYLGYKTKGENADREVVKDKGSLKSFSLGAQYQF